MIFFWCPEKEEVLGLSSNLINRSSIPVYDILFETVDLGIPKIALMHERFKRKMSGLPSSHWCILFEFCSHLTCLPNHELTKNWFRLPLVQGIAILFRKRDTPQLTQDWADRTSRRKWWSQSKRHTTHLQPWQPAIPKKWKWGVVCGEVLSKLELPCNKIKGVGWR